MRVVRALEGSIRFELFSCSWFCPPDLRPTGCAVKRWWSTAGVNPARELVRSTR
jgi:hypothetical protein